MLRKKLSLVFFGWFCLVLFYAESSQAQYFRNNAFQIPIVSWMGFDTTAGWTGSAQAQPWQLTDQVQLGFGYMHSLLRGYGLWYTVQTSVGLGYAKNYAQPPSQIIVGLNVSSGLRYNFLEKRHRPFIAGQAEYLHLFNIALGNGRAFWLGLLFGPGYEWIFANNMGIQLETGAHVLFDFLNPARFTWTARLSYTLYF